MISFLKGFLTVHSHWFTRPRAAWTRGSIRGEYYENNENDLNLRIRFGNIQEDVSTYYGSAEMSWFRWGGDDTGIPFVVSTDRLTLTIDNFARLFVHRGDNELQHYWTCSSCKCKFGCLGEYCHHQQEYMYSGSTTCRNGKIGERITWGMPWANFICDGVAKLLNRSSFPADVRYDLVDGTAPISLPAYKNILHMAFQKKESPWESKQLKDPKSGMGIARKKHDFISSGWTRSPELALYPDLLCMPWLLDYSKWPLEAQQLFPATKLGRPKTKPRKKRES